MDILFLISRLPDLLLLSGKPPAGQRIYLKAVLRSARAFFLDQRPQVLIHSPDTRNVHALRCRMNIR